MVSSKEIPNIMVQLERFYVQGVEAANIVESFLVQYAKTGRLSERQIDVAKGLFLKSIHFEMVQQAEFNPPGEIGHKLPFIGHVIKHYSWWNHNYNQAVHRIFMRTPGNQCVMYEGSSTKFTDLEIDTRYDFFATITDFKPVEVIKGAAEIPVIKVNKPLMMYPQ